MGRLEGKIAIVTGASRGQGAAEARRFVAEGAQVVLTDVLAELGEEVAAELGDGAMFVAHDVRDPEGWDRVVSRTVERFGPPDVLVNNAGVLSLGKFTHEESLDDYRLIVDTNLTGVFLGVKSVVPHMLDLGRGSIVNISSFNGLVGRAGTTAYTASKFAVRGLTKCVALEYGKYGIRCNSVHPGWVDTPIRSIHDIGMDHAMAIYHANMAAQPITRAASADEVAELVVYLASDAPGYCTGSEFVIDGGAGAGKLDPYRDLLAEREATS